MFISMDFFFFFFFLKRYIYGSVAVNIPIWIICLTMSISRVEHFPDRFNIVVSDFIFRSGI